MKVIKKNVYYCEFCKKRSLSGGHLKKHEQRCTNNPNRHCGACGGSVNVSDIVDGYKKRFEIVEKKTSYEFGEIYFPLVVKWVGNEITMIEIDEDSDNCPFCKLAIIRQAGLNRYYFDNKFEFNYKEEAAAFMAEKNAAEYRKEYLGEDY